MKPLAVLFMLSAAASLALPGDLLANVNFQESPENISLHSYEVAGKSTQILNELARKPHFAEDSVTFTLDENEACMKRPFIGRDGQVALTPGMDRAAYYEYFHMNGLPPAWSD